MNREPRVKRPATNELPFGRYCARCPVSRGELALARLSVEASFHAPDQDATEITGLQVTRMIVDGQIMFQPDPFEELHSSKYIV